LWTDLGSISSCPPRTPGTCPIDCADVLVSGQAFEHMEFLWLASLEMARVMRPGGLACVLVPSGGYEHRYPLDRWRFYPDGIAGLARWSGLTVLDARSSSTPHRDYPDDSAGWADTVLVAQKPAGLRARLSPDAALRQLIRRAGSRSARRASALAVSAEPGLPPGATPSPFTPTP
jgi:hypothetical protein